MKNFAVIATLSLLALSACNNNNGFTDKDRATLKESHDLSVQAKATADKAAADARAAREEASKSAKSADKAFRAGQAK